MIFEMENIFISPKNLAKRWDCSASSIYHLCCESDALTRVKLGKKAVRFVLEEVIELEKKRIAQAKKFKKPVDFLAVG